MQVNVLNTVLQMKLVSLLHMFLIKVRPSIIFPLPSSLFPLLLSYSFLCMYSCYISTRIVVVITNFITFYRCVWIKQIQHVLHCCRGRRTYYGLLPACYTSIRHSGIHQSRLYPCLFLFLSFLPFLNSLTLFPLMLFSLFHRLQ